MSGVGVSGLLANLPGTVTPYPVLDFSLGLGGLRTVNDNTARDAIPSNMRQEGMLVYSKLTKAIYGLKADLVTWVLVTTIGLGTQAAWSVDASSGSDNNTGAPGSPLATAEELSQRISPGGAKLTLQQATTATFAAGSYGNLEVNVGWFKGAVAFTHEFIPQGNVTSSAAITLSAVVTQSPTTQVRGELTTLSGTFVAQQRIRVTSGARINSLSYSTGLHANAQNTYVGPWLNYASGSTLPPSVGDTVVVDTLNTTLANISISNSGTGNVHVKDFIVTGGIRIDELDVDNASTTGSNQFVDGCTLSGCGVAGNIGGYLWSCKVVTSCRVKQGNWKIDGCSVQGNLYAFPNTGVSLDDDGNVFDGGTMIVGGTSSSNRGGPAVCRVSGPTEFCNGIAASALSASQGAQVTVGQTMWSGTAPGSNYTTAITIDQGANFTTSVGVGTNSLSIAATNKWSVASGLYSSFSPAPGWVPQYGATVQVLPGSVQNSVVYQSNQAANVGSQNVFSPGAVVGGNYLLCLAIACTTADAAATGNATLTITYTNEAGTTSTKSVNVPLTSLGQSDLVATMQVSHGNNTTPTYAITGITSIGNAKFSYEIEARRMA